MEASQRGEAAVTFLDKYQPQLLSALRIVAGLLFMEHGMQKILHFPPMTMAIPPGAATIIMAAGYIELIGGALIILGLFSRIAAFICSGEMAIAYWMVHFPKGGPFLAVNGGDAAILFCFVFLYLAAAGPGPGAIKQKKRSKLDRLPSCPAARASRPKSSCAPMPRACSRWRNGATRRSSIGYRRSSAGSFRSTR